MKAIISNSVSLLKEYSFNESNVLKSFKRNFNTHLDEVIDVSKTIYSNSNIIGSEYLESPEFLLDKHAYNDLLTFICEETIDPKIYGSSELSNIEDLLSDKINSQLSDDGQLNEVVKDLKDRSISNYLNSLMFQLSETSLENPWSATDKILFNNRVLHEFYTDKDEMRELGFKSDPNSSTEVNKHRVGLVAKSQKKGLKKELVFDFQGLRNLTLELIKEEAPNSSRVITRREIVGKLRNMGVDDYFRNSDIFKYFIKPLKMMGEIGSTNSGYFALTDCNDLYETYRSHLESFKGYHRTLARYKRIASHKGGCSTNFDFNAHEKLK